MYIIYLTSKKLKKSIQFTNEINAPKIKNKNKNFISSLIFIEDLFIKKIVKL